MYSILKTVYQGYRQARQMFFAPLLGLVAETRQASENALGLDAGIVAFVRGSCAIFFAPIVGIGKGIGRAIRQS